MSEWKRLPIARAREIAQKHDYAQVIVIARESDGWEHMATYGMDKENCDVAGKIGDFLKRVMKWPKHTTGKKFTFQLDIEFSAPIHESQAIEAIEHKLANYYKVKIT